MRATGSGQGAVEVIKGPFGLAKIEPRKPEVGFEPALARLVAKLFEEGERLAEELRGTPRPPSAAVNRGETIETHRLAAPFSQAAVDRQGPGEVSLGALQVTGLGRELAELVKASGQATRIIGRLREGRGLNEVLPGSCDVAEGA